MSESNEKQTWMCLLYWQNKDYIVQFVKIIDEHDWLS